MFTWSRSKAFAKDFENFPTKDQDKILDFLDIFEEYGLADFTKYEGKITPSWKGESISSEDYQYAKDNHLWHYHIGIPDFVERHDTYKTSDWVLHFQWIHK
ncbi:hypothetical protein, partial [Vibrio parahaemolyticus]|nr:hypothetical protein [Vibrio parahaemolyticus]